MLYFSGKLGHVLVLFVFWFIWPFPFGLMPDLSIFNSNLKPKLLPGKRVITDGVNRGDPKVMYPDDYRRDKAIPL